MSRRPRWPSWQSSSTFVPTSGANHVHPLSAGLWRGIAGTGVSNAAARSGRRRVKRCRQTMPVRPGTHHQRLTGSVR